MLSNISDIILHDTGINQLTYFCRITCSERNSEPQHPASSVQPTVRSVEGSSLDRQLLPPGGTGPEARLE